MVKNSHTSDLIQGLYQQLKPIFESSEQSIYIYLDDSNKVCNKKFASLLNYASPDEWAKTPGNFPSLFVDDKSQQILVKTFQLAMEKMVASSIKVTWKTKSGQKIDTNVILVPINFQGHNFAMHFISKI